MYGTPTLFLLRAIIVLICLMMVTDSTHAQSRIGKPSPGGMLGTLLNPKVQREIGIQNETEKLQQLNVLSDAMVKERSELRQTTRNDKDQYLAESYRNIELKYREDIKKVLTAEQYQRLLQITWQQGHYRVITEPEVVDALKLNSEQVTKIVTAQREDAERQKDYFAKVPRGENRPTVEQIRRDVEEIVATFHKTVDEILTQSQREKFEEMKGKPFDAKSAPR